MISLGSCIVIWWNFFMVRQWMLCVSATARWDVLSHRLPAISPRRQQLRHWRADADCSTSDACSVPGRHWWQPSSNAVPAPRTWQRGLPRPAARSNGGCHSKWSVSWPFTMWYVADFHHVCFNRCFIFSWMSQHCQSSEGKLKALTTAKAKVSIGLTFLNLPPDSWPVEQHFRWARVTLTYH